MFNKMHKIINSHFKKNIKLYIVLIMFFLAGITSGAFLVRNLNEKQYKEMINYFYGFMQIVGNQNINNYEIFKVSLLENAKFVILIFMLGLTVVGFHLIYIIIFLKGFTIGFSSGILVKILGFNGVVFSFSTLLIKEVIFCPGLLILAVNGIMFSQDIIRKLSKKNKNIENYRKIFLRYFFKTLSLNIVFFFGALIEAYCTTYIISYVAPYINKK